MFQPTRLAKLMFQPTRLAKLTVGLHIVTCCLTVGLHSNKKPKKPGSPDYQKRFHMHDKYPPPNANCMEDVLVYEVWMCLK